MSETNKDLPETPESRNEEYLAFIANGGGEIPETPESRIERYLAYIAKTIAGTKSSTETTIVESHSCETSIVEGYTHPRASEAHWVTLDKRRWYKVTFDGTEYECECFRWFNQDFEERGTQITFCVGNLGLLLDDPTVCIDAKIRSDLPFLICVNRYDNSEDETFTETAGKHTIKIVEVEKEIVTLPLENIFGYPTTPLHYDVNGSSKHTCISLGGPNCFKSHEGSIAVGFGNTLSGSWQMAFGYGNTIKSGMGPKAFGMLCNAEGNNTCAFGNMCDAIGDSAYTQGFDCHVEGTDAHAIGYSCKAIGHSAGATGNNAQALKDVAFAINRDNTANGLGSFAHGYKNTAEGNFSIVGGMQCKTTGNASICEGYQACTNGKYSAAFNYGTVTNVNGQFACGNFNKGNSDTIFEIGCGTSDTARKNGLVVDTSGNLKIKSSLYIGCEDDSSGGTKLPAIPECPTTTDGTYTLKCVVASGKATYSWVKE